MKQYIQLYLFDFDGTLSDSFSAICTAFNQVLVNHGMATKTRQQIEEYIGVPMEDVFEQHITGGDRALAEQYAQEYRRIYDALPSRYSELFPGVKETLKWLHENEKILAIITNKSSASVRQLLNSFSIAELFSDVVGVEDVSHAKPNPEGVLHLLKKYDVETDQAVMIGDTPIDIQTGQAAGIRTIAVTTGKYSADELKAHNPTHTIAAISDLKQDGFDEFMEDLEALGSRNYLQAIEKADQQIATGKTNSLASVKKKYDI